VSANPISVDTASVSDLVEWADSQCHFLANADADNLATRLWRLRMTLEMRQKHEIHPRSSQTLLERITAIREAETDLASLRAILQTMGGPITWRDAADQIGGEAAPR
jgi:hypothetical protein